MRVKKIECFKVNIPFRKKFAISHSSRRYSESVFVKVELDDGTIGWGEALPRKYVTCETQDSVVKVLIKKYIPAVKKWDIKNYNDLIKKLKTLKTKKETNCALCAIEIASLDAFGKHFKKSISHIFGSVKRDGVIYNGIVSADNSLFWHLLRLRLFGFKTIKVKVGQGDDLKRLKKVRKFFGGYADIRMDANCAWTINQTLEKIENFKKYNISAVEQPVRTIKELNKVAEKSNIPIIADESLRTLEDAKRLKNVIFDIRISKCGGLLKSLEIYEYAKKKGIKCMLGCHVGESGILSAAGRHFACSTNDLLYLEGSYNRFLLKKDITKEDLTFDHGGIGKSISGYGLGVEVNEEVLKRFKND